MTFRLGLRLVLAGGRESRLRLAVTAIGVGVGVLLLLLSLTGQAAAQGSAERSGWRSADSDTPATAPDGALFLSVTDYHDGTAMTRAYVAALGPRPPVPPGLERLPAPGEVAVSPAMRRLLESTPDDQLDDRYPGRVTATIADEGLAHPDDLVALIGRTPAQLGAVRSESLQVVRGFGSVSDGYMRYLGLRVFLLVGTALLLVPVVVFIVMATRVAAAHREQRLAAIRLVGATRRQAAVVAAVETGLAAVAGSVLGWAGFEVGRRVLAATVTFQGAHFFAEDVVVAPWLLLLVLVGVPVLAMLTTIAALSRVQVGPLATSRRAHRRPPSAWHALPLASGIAGLLAAETLDGVVDDVALGYLAPLFVIATMVGVVAIGPLLCMLAGRGLARVSRRVPGLLAARRMASDPRATFRAVGGVVLAAFSVTYSASLIDPSGDGPYDGGAGVLRRGVVEVYTGGVPEGQVAPLLDEQAVTTRFDTGRADELVESCAELARVVTLTCSSSGLPGDISVRAGLADTDLPILRVYVLTEGTPAAENRVRSQAANLVPNAIIHTQQDRVDVDARFLGSAGQLLRVGWYFVLVVAACSLTVGMVAGVIERRRPFALLRASGLRLGELRQVVFLETAAAMLVTAAVGVGLGLASSYALALYGDIAWLGPDAGVFATVGVGVLAALVLSTIALPLLDSATRHDTVRYE
ncbi:MAG: FtsX-like permease family protein [Acidimicrobiales bacterium]